MAKIIDGKAFAANMRAEIAQHVSKFKNQTGAVPGLAVILVGEDPASQVYVRNKGKQTVECGMQSFEHKLPADTERETLLNLIDQLNNDPQIHGILCQLPLPDHLDEDEVINAISPQKDVDGFHISNVGLLGTGQKSMVPCTPLGCLLLLRDYFQNAKGQSLSGLNAVVVGRSNIVGKPMAQLLLGESCTVTITHSRTKDIEAICADADILVAAVGRPEMIDAHWLKKGAVVIDVGINRVEAPERGLNEDGSVKRKLVGDVNFDSASGVAEAITPVPGGVGPMTIACLLANTLTSFCRINGLEEVEELAL